jgi:preprotein translocase subunit SecA
MKFVEKSVLLQTLDQVWKEHLLALDHLRQGIGLRAYGQRDPLNEYKREAFMLFTSMLEELKQRITSLLAHLVIGAEPQAQPAPPPMMIESHPSPEHLIGDATNDGSDIALADPATRVSVQPYRAETVDPARPETWTATPRNAACPCGSGKKYKYCHGKV